MIEHYALTTHFQGIAKMLTSPITIEKPNRIGIQYAAKAIWDTGANSSVITPKAVAALQLNNYGLTSMVAIGRQNVKTITYLIDLVLPNGMRFKNIIAPLGSITDEIDILIGMDIISLGDFAVSNFQGNTSFSLRVPSLQRIDFEQNTII
jgi:predicted aspartyl protease